MTDHLVNVDSNIILNHQIALMNDHSDYATLFLHSYILKRMHGKWIFRSRYLKDGPHPDEDTSIIQERELTEKASATIARLVNAKIEVPHALIFCGI